MQVSASSRQSTPTRQCLGPWDTVSAQTLDHASWKDNVGGKAKMLSNMSDTPCRTKLKDFL